MKKTLIVLAVIAFVVAAYVWSVYNRLVTTNESVNSQWSQVETQYQRRIDLIPNLVASVQGVMKQEQKVFGDLAAARASYAGAKTIDEKAAAGSQVESSLSRLLAVVENYPQLKSADTVQTLMVQLEGTENRVSVERKRYNDMVQTFNTMIKLVPAKWIAGSLGFSERKYFEAAAGAEVAPKVNL